jgi:glyoxylase-like metal-dependent hydrolase (beta-lactamase superfamily II)
MMIKGGTFGPVATNSYVVYEEAGGPALVVDPAAGSEQWLLGTLERHALTPVAVLATHGHWDHVVECHLWAARGVPVWAGTGDEDWMRAPAPFNPALFGNPPPTPGVEPARILHEGDVVELGGLRLEMLHTPGHSPGCYVAWERAAGQAIVGDLIFAQGIGRTDFPGSDHAAMMRSLARVLDELPGDTRIHPGHGPWGVTMAEAEPWARMFM